MNKMQIFENEEFGSIRTVEVDGTSYFVGKDVAEVLGHGNHRQAIKSNVDDEDKVVHSMDTLGGKQKITLINESGLYSLIVSSRRPEAKAFKRWVTSEVLPSIRQTGGYGELDIQKIIQQTAAAVVSEVMKQLLPIILESRASAETETPSSSGEMMILRDGRVAHRAKRRRRGLVEMLNTELRDRVDVMLFMENATYGEVVLFLRENGIILSESAIGNYVKKCRCY